MRRDPLRAGDAAGPTVASVLLALLAAAAGGIATGLLVLLPLPPSPGPGADVRDPAPGVDRFRARYREMPPDERPGPGGRGPRERVPPWTPGPAPAILQTARSGAR